LSMVKVLVVVGQSRPGRRGKAEGRAAVSIRVRVRS
jgi:hypothetical protein